VRQHPPSDSAARHVKDRIHDLAQGILPGSSIPARDGQRFFDDLPGFITHIGWVMLACICHNTLFSQISETFGLFIRPLIVSECKRHGIDTSGAVVDPALPTTTSIVLIVGGGERSFLTPRQGTINAYGPEHVDLARIQAGLRVLSVGSLFCAPRLDRVALPGILQKAKEVGAVTVADLIVNPAAGGLGDITHVLPLLDYAVPSQQEAEYFTGQRDPRQAAKALLALGVSNVIVKLGERGALFCSRDRTFEVPAFKVRVVDTTGSGDNFIAGLIYGLVRQQPIEHALRMAAAVAALSIQAVGAGAGVVNLAQVERFLAAYPDRELHT